MSSLEFIGEQFTGEMHNGLDDARNITKILLCLLRHGANPIPNEKILLSKAEQQMNPLTYRFALKTVKILHPEEFYKNYYQNMWKRNCNSRKNNKASLSPTAISNDKENVSSDEPLKPVRSKSRKKSRGNSKSNNNRKKTDPAQSNIGDFCYAQH